MQNPVRFGLEKVCHWDFDHEISECDNIVEVDGIRKVAKLWKVTGGVLASLAMYPVVNSPNLIDIDSANAVVEGVGTVAINALMYGPNVLGVAGGVAMYLEFKRGEMIAEERLQELR